MRRKRPCRRNTTDKADKFPPPHGRLRHERTGHTKPSTSKGLSDVRFGSEPDIRAAKSNVRYGPIADIGLFDDLVSAALKRLGHGNAERHGGLQVNYQLDLGGLQDR